MLPCAGPSRWDWIHVSVSVHVRVCVRACVRYYHGPTARAEDPVGGAGGRSFRFIHIDAASSPTFSVTFGPVREFTPRTDCRLAAKMKRNAGRTVRSSIFNRGERRQAPAGRHSEGREEGGRRGKRNHSNHSCVADRETVQQTRLCP